MRLFAIAIALLIPAYSFAAQDAVVTVEQAAVRETPTMDAESIQNLNAGTKVRVSQYNKDGWYKIKSKSGKYGWIWQADITILAYTTDVETANLEMQKKSHDRRSRAEGPWLFVRTGGSVYLLTSADVSHRLRNASSTLYPGLGGFLEVATRIGENYRLALRLGTYSASSSLSHKNVTTGLTTSYTITHKGTPVLFGLDTDILQTEIFQLAGGIYAGFGMSNTTTIQSDQPAPNSTELSQNYFAAMLNFAAKYWFAHRFAIVGEFGVYYSRIPKSDVKPPFNGDAPFRQADGNLGSLIVNHLGPVIGLGIQFSL